MTDRLFSLDFPRALSRPAHRAGFRTFPEDFRVDEVLGFYPAGEGEHLYLKIRKTGENTRWIAHRLAGFYGVPDGAVGYCGMKDRRAVTTQWFSVHLPGAGDFGDPQLTGCEILETARHRHKLKPGMHAGNGFVIVLRCPPGAREDLDRRLAAIAAGGVPNYFGEQRFGRDGGNLREVAGIVASGRPRFRGKRGGIYLSAARAWLFNQVLAAHVASGEWRCIPDGPLWGRGRLPVAQSLAEQEQAILASWNTWCDALEHSGLRQQRRTLVLTPDQLTWRWSGDNLNLSFALPPGAYATAVLREVAELAVPALGHDYSPL